MYIILLNIQKNRTLDLNAKIITIQFKKSKKELHYNVNEFFTTTALPSHIPKSKFRSYTMCPVQTRLLSYVYHSKIILKN